ncbi:MAG: SDR family oxidoreductase [Bacteroidales bacterium]|nr:SDR family oxidoreductase [Bacteroidales bacterium]
MKRVDIKKSKGVALITGASSGIGEAFAKELAAMNHDITIVARRQDKLEQLSAELKTKHNVNINIIPADLATETGIEKIEEYISCTKDLDLLINCAGFGLRGDFHNLDKENISQIIDVHLKAPSRFCKAAIPVMRDRGYGYIINVSSLAAFFPFKGSAIYVATKIYLVYLSKAIQKEVRRYNIKIQALCPGLTNTGFHYTEAFKDFDRSTVPKNLWMQPDVIAKKSINALKNRKVVYIPGFKNKVMGVLTQIGNLIFP